MFAVFGEIIFTLLTAPRFYQSSRSWDYAEHHVVESQPRLQWIGSGLERITLEMMFHASFTTPALQMAALLGAASDHIARPLVFGNGDHQGYFVLTSIDTVSTEMTDGGDFIEIVVRTVMREWALALEIDPNGPPIPALFPIGIVPSAASQTVSAISQPVSGAAGMAAPGVSAILNMQNSTGRVANGALPGDISPSMIVRSVV